MIFMSLGVAPARVKVADLFCRNRLGGTVVDMGFECGLVMGCANGWGMDEEEQMEEVEEPKLLIGCDFQGRKINFLNSKTLVWLVGVATDRNAGVTLDLNASKKNKKNNCKKRKNKPGEHGKKQ